LLVLKVLTTLFNYLFAEIQGSPLSPL